MSNNLGKLDRYLENCWPAFWTQGKDPVDVAIRVMKHLDQQVKHFWRLKQEREFVPDAKTRAAYQEILDVARGEAPK